MADTSSVDVILEFLRRNRFTRAEAALRGELSNRPDLNGLLQKLTLEDNNSGKVLEEQNGNKLGSDNQGLGSRNSGEVSKELIVKEIECGTGRNGPESKWRNSASVGERSSKPNEAIGAIDSEDTVLDLYSWNFNPSNGPDPYQNDVTASTNNFSGRVNVKSAEEVVFSSEKRSSWLRSATNSNVNVDSKYEKIQMSEPKELDQQLKTNAAYSADNLWPRGEEPTSSSADLWKDCSVKTVFPFPKGDVSTSYDITTSSDKREGKKKADTSDARAAIKEQVDEVGRALYFGKSQGITEQKNLNSLGFPLASDNPKEEFPRLPPVKLKSDDKPLNVNWQEKFERDGLVAKVSSADNTYLIGSYLDVPVGQEINSSGPLV